MSTVASDRPHGLARYKNRTAPCRCFTCRRDNARNDEVVARMKAAGTWQPFTEAGPVREHVERLIANGWSAASVADASDVARHTVMAVLGNLRSVGVRGQVRAETARRLLAVRGLPADAARILGVGSQRRVQALSAIGWPLSSQSARIGWLHSSSLGPLLARKWVYRETSEKIAAVYAELSMIPAPPGKGASNARNNARRKGWFPPLAWDDDAIDDPAAFPVLMPPPAGEGPHADELAIQHRMAGHDKPITPDGERALARRLLDAGWSVHRTARWLHRSEDFVMGRRGA